MISRLVPVFMKLKLRLMINGYKHSFRSFLTALSLVLQTIALFVFVSIAGSAFLFLSEWDSPIRFRMVTIGLSALIGVWWLVPLVTGGVDESVDPRRLTYLPLQDRDLRQGQIAAGLVSPIVAASAVVLALAVIGSARSIQTGLGVSVVVVVTLVYGVVGARCLATGLALLSRSRRGSDAAALFVALFSAFLFFCIQMVQFATGESLDDVARYLRFAPVGWPGAAFWAARVENWDDYAVFLSLELLGIVAFAFLWSHWLNKLLLVPDEQQFRARKSTIVQAPLFVGLRKRLPQTPGGAAVAKEMIYLVRQPGRRVALITGTVLGLVYLLVIFARGTFDPDVVLGAPVAVLFTLQYAFNQFGADPQSFWIEVVVNPHRAARYAGRAFLAAVVIVVPSLMSGIVAGVITGGWIEFVVMIAAVSFATPAVIACGALGSSYFVVPIPDSGNPFANRQATGAQGCLNGFFSLIIFWIGVMIVGPVEMLIAFVFEFALIPTLVILGIECVVCLVLSKIVYSFAFKTLQGRELAILEVLDEKI